jgi:heat shock protein HslJ
VTEPRLTGVEWQWNGLLEGHPAALTVVVPDPHNYRLTLDDDGAYHAKADCNRLNGRYSMSGDDLVLQPGPMTRAYCGPESLSDRFVALLGMVTGYELRDGQLVLGLADDAGSMYLDVG